jgi:hypothetical protein
MSTNLLRGPMEIDGLTLRPFSLRSRLNCMALGLTLFTEAEGVQLSPLQVEEQILALAWERSQPVGVVRKAIDAGIAWDAIHDFADSLPLGALPKLVSEINRVASEIKEQTVTVVPRSDSVDKDAPGNS